MANTAVLDRAIDLEFGAITGKAQIGSDNNSYQKQIVDPWLAKLRPSQHTPEGDWFIWLIRAGRGWGKTLTGAVWMFQQTEFVPYVAIVAATYGDGRDYCIEGESGLKAICPDLEWNRSLGEMRFPSGCRGKLFSAEEPDRMRGPNIYKFWCDEYANWKYRKWAFEQLMLMARKGENLQGVITTTPKPGALKELESRPTTIVTRGTTLENIENLSPVFLREVIQPLEGTTLGRQELEGLDIDDTPGALWKRALIEELRITDDALVPEMTKIVVAIDPAASNNADSNETGIVVAGRGTDGKGYLLHDRTLRGSPNEWATKAVTTYQEFKADLVVIEDNQGGDMAEHTLRTVDDSLPIRRVHASRGKTTRAQPIASLYEQKRIHHVGTFSTLEDQLCTWVPGEDSPDRLDALVWAFTSLMVGVGKVRFGVL